jgi:hypothetical protein
MPDPMIRTFVEEIIEEKGFKLGVLVVGRRDIFQENALITYGVIIRLTD